MSVTRSSKEYFDSLGTDWDRIREGLFSDRVREAALEQAGVRAGGAGADLGAGTGFVTAGLLERGVRVIAVDQSPAMLAALRRKFPWPDRVDCRRGEAERLPVADAALDYCLANMFLHHVESPPLAIREMARILKPGGRAVVTDLETHDLAFLATEHHDRWMGFERPQVNRWFLEAGFTDVRVEPLGERCCAAPPSGDTRSVSIFMASGTR